jgi:salicylate hydroxylase
MKVIIVGAGTGGLAVAIALRRIGLDPIVLEQQRAFAPIGAGLGLAANSMRVLTHLGADRHVRSTAVPTLANYTRDLLSNEAIDERDGARVAQAIGEHYYCAHRADLLDTLLGPLPPESIRLGCRVVGVEETPDDVAVELEGGEVLRADLLIGADGLNSKVRTLVFGDVPTRFTGTVVWRGLIPAERVPEEYYASITTWFGPRRHVMLYPVRNLEHPEPVYNYSGFVPVEEVHRESWTADADIDDLRASLDGVHPSVSGLLDGIETALITGIYFRDPLETWSTEHVVLIGDGAHPAPPSAGQGAGMALEDAVMLAACLQRTGPEAVPAALAEFERRRRDRTEQMLAVSRMHLAYRNEDDPLRIRARNGLLRGIRRLSPVGDPSMEWLQSYDPVQAASQNDEEFDRSQALPANPLLRPEARRAFEAWRGALRIEDRAGLWIGERDGYARFVAECSRSADGPPPQQLDCDGVPALLVAAPDGRSGGPVALHLHGGGFVLGSAQCAVGEARRIAAAIGGAVLVVDYRLAPEHPYPAALDDVRRAYRYLRAHGRHQGLIVTGECAGGNLALALALSLRDEGAALPDALFLVSPLVDLSLSADNVAGRLPTDPWFSRDSLTMRAGAYLHGGDPTAALVSPVYADLHGLPPLSITAATGEVCFPGIERFAAAASAVGVDVDFVPVEDSVHSFVLFDELPETAAALGRLGDFARRVSGRATPAANQSR